jgi:site-specific DNA-methyltransferase (cytosine-N4-specific)
MLIHGHVLDVLPTLDAESVQCCVTSPPYWGLRDYGLPGVEWPDGWTGQLGLEPTPELYVEHLVAVFREVRRVLRDDGVLWLNLGDSYMGGGGYSPDAPSNQPSAARARGHYRPTYHENSVRVKPMRPICPNLKPKDLAGIPWRVAFALQADGWWLRSDIIWAKPNPMPESVTDRPTRAHEYIFLLTKSARYYYDADAIAEPAVYAGREGGGRWNGCEETRNARSVWTVPTTPFPEAHFAVFPEKIPSLCIRAGSREGDTVLDPFMGSGTTALVAEKLGRRWVGIEANADYIEIANRRLAQPTLWVAADAEGSRVE